MRLIVLRDIAEPPADGFDFFEAAEGQVEDEADGSDEEHGGYDEVVTLAGVAGVDDEIAEAGVYGDHFGGDDDQPCDAERDAQADDDLRKGSGKDDFGEELRGGEAEVAASAAVHGGDVGDAVDAGHDDGEVGSEEDEEDGGVVAYAEEDDGDGNPCDGADGAEDLHGGVDDLVGGGIPAEGEADGDAEDDGCSEADGYAAKGVDDVGPEDVLVDELGHASFDFEGRGEDFGAGPADGEVPEREQERGGKDGPEVSLPLLRFG